jgi:hypothetical protein
MSGSSDSTPPHLPTPPDAEVRSDYQDDAPELDGLDLPALKARIRAAAALRRDGHGLPPTAPAPIAAPSMAAATPFLASAGAGWSAVFGRLADVDRLAHLGATIPEMTAVPRPLWPLARLLGRVVLYLARFLTRQQTEYNQAVLAALQQLSGAAARRLNEMERQLLQTQEALREAERRLDELQQRPSKQRRDENSADAPQASAA